MTEDRARTRLAAFAAHIAAPHPRQDQLLAARYVPELSQLAVVHTAADPAGPQASACARRRTVVVAGARTPFVKAFTDLRKNDAINLGMAAVGGLLARTKLDPALVDQLIFGNVVLNSAAPNLAREIVIDLNLPRTIAGTTVSVACLSGLDAINSGSLAIEHGQAQVVIAGGSDSLSNGELNMPRRFTQALAMYQMGGGNKKGWQGFKQMLSEAGPVSTWAPKPNSVSERSTGKTMGYHADVMAELNQIQRKDQDAFAISSHQKAAKAQQSGVLAQEIVPVKSELNGKMVTLDNIIRGSINAQKVAELPPVFRPTGTVTAASSSPLTDGASAVLLMSATKAKELGLPADVFIRSYAKTAIDPNPQLLLAPAVAIHLALKAAGLQLADIDYFEIHEAFAAQVLSTLKVLQDKDWARKALKLDGPVGTIPLEKINPHGGSIAIGHPFAATGGRLVTSVVNELRRTNKRLALISICAAGGIGGVMILERVPQ